MHDKIKAIFNNQLLFLSLGVLVACSQDAQKAQEAEKPEQPKPKSVKVLMVDSQKHLLKPLSGDLISFNVFVKGGVANYPKKMAGIEALALQSLIESGPKGTKPREWENKLKKTGIKLDYKTQRDYSVLQVQVPEKNWPKAWKMIRKLIQRPDFPRKIFKAVKKDLIKKAEKRTNRPESYLADQAMAFAFQSGDYSKHPMGTAESLKALKRRDVLLYFKAMMTSNRAMTVSSGNLDSFALTNKLKGLLRGLPEKAFKYPADTLLEINQSSIGYFDKDVEANHLRGFFSVPPAGTKENLAMRFALSMLKTKLKERTKKGAVREGALKLGVLPLSKPVGFFTGKSENPSDLADAFIKTIEETKRNGFDSVKLVFKKKRFLTEYFLERETTKKQAYHLGKAEMLHSWVNSEVMEKWIKSLRVETINRVFNRYLNGIQWFYLGERSAVEEDKFLQPF